MLYSKDAKEITVPAGTESIREGAFADFTNLERIDLPESLHYIHMGAFKGCIALKSITIPKGVSSIARDAFNGCDHLSDIFVQEGNRDYASVDGVLFSADEKVLYYCPKGKSGTYEIPCGVKAFDPQAFDNCPMLTEICFPSTLDSWLGYYDEDYFGCSHLEGDPIEHGHANTGAYITSLDSTLFSAECWSSQYERWYDDGYYTEPVFMPLDWFSGCTALRKLSVTEGNPYLHSKDGIMFYKEKRIFIPPQIEGDITIDRFQNGSMFQGRGRITSLTVLEGALPEGTDFSGCSSLRTLKVGKDHIKDQNVQEAVQKYKLKLEYFEEKVNFIRVLLPLLIMTVLHVLYYLYFRGGEVKPHFLLVLGLFVLDVIGFCVMGKEDKANSSSGCIVTLCEIVYVLLFICSLVFTIGFHPLAFILLTVVVVFGIGMLLF